MHKNGSNALSALLLEIEDASELAVRRVADLSPRELAGLVLVRNRSGCSVSWLHQRLGLTQSGAVRMVDRLEGLGLVGRARQPGRREVSLTVTPEGEAAVQRGVEARSLAIEDLLSGLSADDRETFLGLAERALAVQTRSRDEGDEVCRLCDWRRCTPDCPVDGWECGTEAVDSSVASA
jgi:DNA-binding MarR family transcriptional regulator